MFFSYLQKVWIKFEPPNGKVPHQNGKVPHNKCCDSEDNAQAEIHIHHYTPFWKIYGHTTTSTNDKSFLCNKMANTFMNILAHNNCFGTKYLKNKMKKYITIKIATHRNIFMKMRRNILLHIQGYTRQINSY